MSRTFYSPLFIMLLNVLSVFATSDEFHSKEVPEAICRDSGMLQISINPRMELLAVIQFTSISRMVHRGGPYAEAIAAWFSEYREHPVKHRLLDMEECGYVQKVFPYNKDWYIVPLCSFHNHSTGELDITDSVTLVSANKSETCEK
ncbi:MAG: hypothetical protein PHS23_04005 [Candidatus Cloacimonetes bacterium]|nr:hypothetical protein [Candidatus Cloacimonadota bacterium]